MIAEVDVAEVVAVLEEEEEVVVVVRKATVNQSESHRFETDGRGLQASEPSSDDSPS